MPPGQCRSQILPFLINGRDKLRFVPLLSHDPEGKENISGKFDDVWKNKSFPSSLRSLCLCGSTILLSRWFPLRFNFCQESKDYSGTSRSSSLPSKIKNPASVRRLGLKVRNELSV